MHTTLDVHLKGWLAWVFFGWSELRLQLGFNSLASAVGRLFTDVADECDFEATSGVLVKFFKSHAFGGSAPALGRLCIRLFFSMSCLFISFFLFGVVFSWGTPSECAFYSMERWLSGLRHTPGKRAYPNRYRGFESLPLRH